MFIRLTSSGSYQEDATPRTRYAVLQISEIATCIEILNGTLIHLRGGGQIQVRESATEIAELLDGKVDSMTASLLLNRIGGAGGH
jgi:hypothetical protein